MTFRGYNARLIGVVQNGLEQQKAMTMAITMGIAGAFAKEDGMKSMLGALDDSQNKLRDAMAGLFEGGVRDTTVVGGAQEETAHRSVIQPPPRQSRRRERTTEDIQRDIRRLDAIASKVFGASVKNPLGGYDQGFQSVSAYDVGRTSTNDLVSRM